MPYQDNYLILSNAQTVLSTGSTASNTPFDLGKQISGEYGQSPYATTNLNFITGGAQIGQSVKKFFFQVKINYGASGGTAGVGLTVALQSNATSGASGWVSVFSTAKILKGTTPYLTTAGMLICKVPLFEEASMNRYIKGLYTIGTGTFTAFKIDAELSTY